MPYDPWGTPEEPDWSIVANLAQNAKKRNGFKRAGYEWDPNSIAVAGIPENLL